MTIHWTKLKKAVEDAGGTWTNRDDAEVFLANRGIEVADEPAPVAAPAQIKRVALDRSLPYADVFGSVENAPGARFMQGGTYFNTKGEQVG